MANLIYHAGTAGKIKMNQLTRAVCHTFRKTKNVYKNHGNVDINKSLTKYNDDFTLLEYEGMTVDEIVRARIAKEYQGKTLRKDAVVLREVITAPSSDIFEGMDIEQRKETMNKFVRDAHSWFAFEFGEDNVVGASIHLDETSPHIHVAIMPMTDKGSLAQKKFFKSPADLKRQHRQYREHMRKRGWDFDLDNKYEDVDAFELPVYKANAKKIEAMRKEQTDAIRELARKPDLKKAAFDIAFEAAYQDMMSKSDVELRELSLKELERKRAIFEEFQKMYLEKLKAEKDTYEELNAEMRQMLYLSKTDEERNKIEKPSFKELRGILEQETNNRFTLAVHSKTKEHVLCEIKDGKRVRVTEEKFIRELSSFVTDGDGEMYVDLEGNAPISYVLGHYRSDKGKTQSEAHEDGLRTISKVHIQMALEKQKELEKDRQR